MKEFLEKENRRLKDHRKKFIGQAGENTFKTVMQTRGHNVKRTGIGSDFQIGKKHYEIKTGSSRLSKTQRRLRKKLGKNFEEVRYGTF